MVKLVRLKLSIDYLLIVILVLFSIDFYLQGILIFILGAIGYPIIKGDRTLQYSPLLLSFVVFFIFLYIYSDYFEISIIKTVIALPIAFSFGSSISNISPKKISFLLLICAFTMAFHAILNMLYNFKLYGIMAIGLRLSSDFWTGEVSLSTGQAAKMVPFLSCVFVLLFYNKNNRLKLFSFVTFILLIVYNFALGGRSVIILTVLSIVISLCLIINRERDFKLARKLIIILSFTVFAFVLLYIFNIFSIQELFEESSFSQRFNSEGGQDIEEDDRMSRKIRYLENIFKYPFGGQHLCFDEHIGHAHDLWLDCFDMVGFIPFILIVLYTIFSVLRAKQYYRNQYINTYYGVMIFSFFIIMNIQFFLEPIIEGSPKLLILYCFIDGLITNYLSLKRKTNDIAKFD